MLDLGLHVERVVDCPTSVGPHFSSGTNSGTISASNMLPPQVGTIVHVAVGQRALEDVDALVAAHSPIGIVSVQV